LALIIDAEDEKTCSLEKSSSACLTFYQFQAHSVPQASYGAET